MKHLFLGLIAALVLTRTYGQTAEPATTNVLRDYTYESVASDGTVKQLSATNDSLFITYMDGSSILGRDAYQITGNDKKGVYHLVYVKMDLPAKGTARGQGGQSPYGVFVFRFEKDNGKVLTVHDGRTWHTLEQAKYAYSMIWPQDQYFNTWYAEPRFAMFIQYPDFKNAGMYTVEKVALDWIKKLQEHNKRKLNTVTEDTTGAEYVRDNLTKVLVNNRISPLISREDFDRKLRQYHLMLVKTHPAAPRPVAKQVEEKSL